MHFQQDNIAGAMPASSNTSRIMLTLILYNVHVKSTMAMTVLGRVDARRSALPW